MARERPRDELRPLTMHLGYTDMTPGSVLIEMGRTRVLCTAAVEADVPRWLRDSGKGWVTAEYGMLPGSSSERIGRDQYQKGRALEISRLIGRALRSVVDLKAMGECMVRVDCDVLQADGGTRTAAITGAWVALNDAFEDAVGPRGDGPKPDDRSGGRDFGRPGRRRTALGSRVRGRRQGRGRHERRHVRAGPAR